MWTVEDRVNIILEKLGGTYCFKRLYGRDQNNIKNSSKKA